MKKTAVLLLLLALVIIVNFIDLTKANFKPYPYPEVTVVSPSQNGIYNQSTIPLRVEVEMYRYDGQIVFETLTLVKYSLDGQAQINAIVNNEFTNGRSTGYTGIVDAYLSALSVGSHTLVIYGETSFTKYPQIPETNFTKTIYFTVKEIDPNAPIIDVNPPKITILSTTKYIGNQYKTPNIRLIFKLNEEVVWIGYSIDAHTNVTISGNTTLTDLSSGFHTLRVYARDAAGNVGASTLIEFMIEYSSEHLSLLSPQNQTYTDNVPLIFVETTSLPWIVYFLDNQPMVQVYGNGTLPKLSVGSHRIFLRFHDNSGLEGSSNTFFFTVTESFPTMPITASIGIISIVSVSLLIYFKKHKHRVVKKL